MTVDIPLLRSMRALIAASECHDVRDHISFSGPDDSLTALRLFATEAARLNLPTGLPDLDVEGQEPDLAGEWSVQIGKDVLIDRLGITRELDESVILFLKFDAFTSWLANQLGIETPYRWTKLTILVDGLTEAVAGPSLRVFGLESKSIAFDTVAAADYAVRRPAQVPAHLAPPFSPHAIGATALTSGAVGAPEFALLRARAEQDAASMLCSETFSRGALTFAALRSGKTVVLPMRPAQEIETSSPSPSQLKGVQDAFIWVYADQRDTRHALFVDRLALDAERGESLIGLLRRAVPEVLEDARDRYRVFVLGKKDQAAKEARDILKDVRAQADLFASKVRDLVSGFLRDLLASTLLIGLGLIGRLKSDELAPLVKSTPVDAFFKFLACYFVGSTLLQVSTSWRDLHLTDRELKRWWRRTRSHVPGRSMTNLLEQGLGPRRRTFGAVVVIIVLLNLAVAGVLWNWKWILDSFLRGDSLSASATRLFTG